jgi:hypothetical protein
MICGFKHRFFDPNAQCWLLHSLLYRVVGGPFARLSLALIAHLLAFRASARRSKKFFLGRGRRKGRTKSSARSHRGNCRARAPVANAVR